MTITLTPEMEHLVQSKVERGLFGSPVDVVYEGLLLLDQEEARLEELKSEIAVGMEQAENGQVRAFDPEGLKVRVRQELAKG